MKALVNLGTLCAVLCLTGCDDSSPTQPKLGDEPGIEAHRGHGFGARRISALSRNLYIGFNVDETIAALATGDPEVIQDAITAAIQTLSATDFPTRAGAMADEVARLKPDFLGLQEVYELDIDLNPAFGVPRIQLPFLLVFQQALADRGLNYVVAAQNTVTDALLANPLLGTIHLVDHDVLLVNPERVDVREGTGGQFSANLGDPFGIGVNIVRGWTKVRATVAGIEAEVWNTHPESGSDPAIAGLRAGQMGELAAMASTELPVIVMGDLNDEPGSPMYQVMMDAGFEDLWTELRRRAPGNTCCHVDDLSNDRANMDQRIDYVMARGFGEGRGGVKGMIRLTGKRRWERVDGPYYELWPSDHAGVFAKLLVRPVRGTR
jgi:endonuclease/exonuclease/phosphatase family metal-dependent hydrolase